MSERAGPSEDYDDIIIMDFEREDWEALQMSAAALTPLEVVRESSSRFGGWDGFRALVERLLPEGIA